MAITSCQNWVHFIGTLHNGDYACILLSHADSVLYFYNMKVHNFVCAQ